MTQEIAVQAKPQFVAGLGSVSVRPPFANRGKKSAYSDAAAAEKSTMDALISRPNKIPRRPRPSRPSGGTFSTESRARRHFRHLPRRGQQLARRYDPVVYIPRREAGGDEECLKNLPAARKSEIYDRLTLMYETRFAAMDARRAASRKGSRDNERKNRAEDRVVRKRCQAREKMSGKAGQVAELADALQFLYKELAARQMERGCVRMAGDTGE